MKTIELLSLNLKRVREEKSFTQEHLADASGMSLSTIKNIERMANFTTEVTIDVLAQTLGVDPSELFRSNTPPEGPKAELIALIQDADESAIQTMLNVMKPMLEMAANKAKTKKI